MAISSYSVLGLMSGTSLDGLDIACCRFERSKGRWEYRILRAETVPYTRDWKDRLMALDRATAADLAGTDAGFGRLMGELTKQFIETYHLSPDFIASHGHTVFHRPSQGWTTQIGSGAALAAATGLPVVCDFRSADVALGGQGAPLVPVGDHLLFPGYRYCLNLGGFANISYEQDERRIAFDICPVNSLLNSLAAQTGVEYDDGGRLARSGSLIKDLLEQLDALPYYSQPPPKSLGKEWTDENIWPLIPDAGYRMADAGYRIPDLLHTCCEHMARQIGKHTGQDRAEKLLITGGGALNGYLIERISHYAAPEIVIPDLQTIHFKEALIFAFLGLLRWRNEVNILASVTGATRDSIGGAVYRP